MTSTDWTKLLGEFEPFCRPLYSLSSLPWIPSYGPIFLFNGSNLFTHYFHYCFSGAMMVVENCWGAHLIFPPDNNTNNVSSPVLSSSGECLQLLVRAKCRSSSQHLSRFNISMCVLIWVLCVSINVNPGWQHSPIRLCLILLHRM